MLGADSSWRLPIVNLALPGAGLLIGGRLLSGLSLLVPAIIILALMLGVIGLCSPALAWSLIGWLALAYVALAATAAGLAWRFARRQQFDPALVRAVHREAAAAYLTGKRELALANATRLTRLAPEEAGVWHFLALIATDAGQPGLARKAAARAAAIDDR